MAPLIREENIRLVRSCVSKGTPTHLLLSLFSLKLSLWNWISTVEDYKNSNKDAGTCWKNKMFSSFVIGFY
jgi:hypothetical protein